MHRYSRAFGSLLILCKCR